MPKSLHALYFEIPDFFKLNSTLGRSCPSIRRLEFIMSSLPLKESRTDAYLFGASLDLRNSIILLYLDL